MNQFTLQQHLLFFDFEFNPENLSPISFGLVSQDQWKIYHEFKLDSAKIKSNFVREMVLPLLSHDAMIDVSQFGQLIIEEIAKRCAEINVRTSDVTLVCDSQYDLDIFKSLAGDVFEIHLLKFDDFEDERDFEVMYDAHFDDVSRPRHHAGNDAEALMNAYIGLQQGKQLDQNIKMKSSNISL